MSVYCVCKLDGAFQEGALCWVYFALSELTCLLSLLGLEVTTGKLQLSSLNFLFLVPEFLASLLKLGHSGKTSRNQLYFGLTVILSFF